MRSHKTKYLPRRTSHSRVARPTSVGSPETVAVNLGRRTHYEANFEIGPEFGHHPVDLPGPLQRLFEGERGVRQDKETYLAQYLSHSSTWNVIDHRCLTEHHHLNRGATAARPLNPVLYIEVRRRLWDASRVGVTNTAPEFPRDRR